MSSESVPLRSSVSMDGSSKGIRYIELLCIVPGSRTVSSEMFALSTFTMSAGGWYRSGTPDRGHVMGQQIHLREVTEDDLERLFQFQLDRDAVRMAAFPSRDREAFFAH